MVVDYLPVSERKKDSQYHRLLKKILNKGDWVRTQQGDDALRILGHEMRFDLANGFPLVTTRDMLTLLSGKLNAFEMATAELVAFLNGAVTQKQLAAFGCTYWKDWLTEEKCAKRGLPTGHMGFGSYGHSWTAFGADSETSVGFNQINTLIEQAVELPHLRTLFVTPFQPQYYPRGKGKKQRVVVVPCHGLFTLHINTEIQEISMVHIQRSADVPVGLTFNMIHYADLLMALTMVISLKSGINYKPKELVYYIVDAHIYEKQIPAVKKMLKTKPQVLPTVIIERKISEITEFRPQHFFVKDYNPQLPWERIWTPV